MKTSEALHPYQTYCVDYLLEHKKCGLFLDMGLGKTVIVLKAIEELMNNMCEIQRVLVVAPKRVARFTWSEEIRKWDDIHLSINVAAYDSKKRNRKAVDTPSDIVAVTRDGVKWLYEYLCETERYEMFDMIIVDESSSFKNRASERWQALNRMCSTTKRIVLLTGTPVPNGYQDLWSQIYLLDRGKRLGVNITSYRKNFFDWNDHGGHFVTYDLKKGSEERIREKISDICVSMKSEDYLTLPEKMYNNVDVVLSDRVMKTYRKMENDLFVEFREKAEKDGNGNIVAIEAANAAAMTSKLLQITSGAVYDEDGNWHRLHDEKTETLKEIVEANEGKPILVFYNFRFEYERLCEEFAKLGPRTIKTEQDIRDWNEGKIPLLLVNPASAGHGLNLQAGGHITR